MAGGFVKTLAIAAKINTSQVAAEARKIGAQMDAGIREAAVSASASMGAFDQAIDRVKEKAREIEEPLSEGLQALHSLGQRSTAEIQAQIEKIKAAYEAIRNDASLTDRDKDVAFAKTREQVQRLEMELKRGIPQAARQGAAGAEAAMGGFKNVLRSIWSQVAGPLAGIFAIGGSISSYISGASNAGNMAEELKVDVEELQIWSGAMERAGGSADSLKATIQKLNASGKANGDVFGTLLSLSEKANTMSKEAFEQKAKELEIDEKTIQVLYKGRKALEEHLKRQEELGVYSKEDAEISKKFKQAISDLGTAWNSFTSFIGRFAVPIMKTFADVLTSVVVFLRQHTPFVVAAISLVGAALGIRLLPPLRDIPKYLNNIWKAFMRWAPFIAIVGILAILIDDFVGYLTGAETEFGEFWAIFGTGPEILAKLTAAWETLKEVGLTVLEGFKKLVGYFYTLGQATGYFAAWGQQFRGLIQVIKGIFSGDFALIGEGLANIIKGWAKGVLGAFRALVTIIHDASQWIWDALRDSFPSFKEWSDGIINIIRGLKNFDFKQAFLGLVDAVSGASKMLGSLFHFIISTAAEFVEGLIKELTGWDIDLSGAFESVWNAITSTFTALKEWVVEWFSALFDIELPDFGAIAQSIWDSITGIFNDLKTWVIDWFKNLFSGISLPGIGDLLGGAADMAKGAVGVAGNVLGGAVNLGKSAFSWLSSLFGGSDDEDIPPVNAGGGRIKKGDDPVPPAQNAAAVFSSAMKDSMDLEGMFDDAEPQASQAGQAVSGVMADTASTVEDGFNSAWSSTASVAVSEFEAAASTIQAIFSSVIENIGSSLGGLIAGAQAMAADGSMVPAFAGVRAQNSSVSNVNSSNVNIGTMNVATRATDAKGVARGMSGALQKNRLVQAGQSGVNQK